MHRIFLTFFFIGSIVVNCQAEDPVFVPQALTQPGEFTTGIEGPACDQSGNVFAVNFGKQQTIGRVEPSGKGTLWVTLPGNSVGNGIVFDPKGTMYIADYVGHNVLRVNAGSKNIETFAHEPAMNQPNDLAIADRARVTRDRRVGIQTE